MAKTALFIVVPSAATAETVRAPAAQKFLARMGTAGVAVVAVVTDSGTAGGVLAALNEGRAEPVPMVEMPTWNPLGLLRAGRALGVEMAGSWLVSGDVAGIAAAATAGMHGVVLVGVDPPAEDMGVVVNRAEELGDVPRVLIPRGGGCWH